MKMLEKIRLKTKKNTLTQVIFLKETQTWLITLRIYKKYLILITHLLKNIKLENQKISKNHQF